MIYNNLPRFLGLQNLIRKHLFLLKVLSISFKSHICLFLTEEFHFRNSTPQLPIYFCLFSLANYVFKWPRGSQLCMLASTFKCHTWWCLGQLIWGLCEPRSPPTLRMSTHRVIQHTGNVWGSHFYPGWLCSVWGVFALVFPRKCI